jgi:hypothetical protein
VVRAGNGRPLRKVPAPGNAGSGGSPAGESLSSGAETTQSGGTVMALRRRIHRDMVKRPTPREQALTDGMNSFRDRRGERAVECCLKRNGAYYHDLARPRQNSAGYCPSDVVPSRVRSPPVGSQRDGAWSSGKDSASWRGQRALVARTCAYRAPRA